MPRSMRRATCSHTAVGILWGFRMEPSAPLRTRCSTTLPVAEETGGEGNQVVDIDALLVDRLAKDLHLSASSPAKEAAKGVDVSVDFDGNPRPAPARSFG